MCLHRESGGSSADGPLAFFYVLHISGLYRIQQAPSSLANIPHPPLGYMRYSLSACSLVFSCDPDNVQKSQWEFICLQCVGLCCELLGYAQGWFQEVANQAIAQGPYILGDSQEWGPQEQTKNTQYYIVVYGGIIWKLNSSSWCVQSIWQCYVGYYLLYGGIYKGCKWQYYLDTIQQY